VIWVTGRKAPPPAAKPSVSTGFTLIELMVVLAIMLLMGAIFPFVLRQTLPHERVVSGSQRLRAAIHEAESRSRGTGEPGQLDVDTLSKLLPAGTRLSLNGPEGTPLTEITVYPDGSVTAARIDVSEGAQHQTLVTSALTGRVRVE
jgi:general secretion pathway protein H